jgi:salicylate hydroxylase
MRETNRTVLIAGGGIAGLAAALCLSKRGFRAEIFEKAASFETVGAGLQISPNAFRILDEIGVARTMKPLATGPTAIRIMSARTARQIAQVPLGDAAIERFGAPYLVVHRADLQGALAGAACDDPDISMHMGTRIEDVAVHVHGVTALAYHGGTITERHGMALVAADGVWSRLRQTQFDGGDARYSGLAAWRGLIPTEGMPGSQDLENVQLWLSPDAHAVSYPVRGGRYLNLVAITPWKPANGEAPPREWAGEVEAEELVEGLKGWDRSILALVASRVRWTRWPLFSAPRLGRWSNGPVALAGDAAHAMLPFAAQGAAMAIEDGAVLARLLDETLSRGGTAAEAFILYDRTRRHRVARAARLAIANRFIYHLPRPLDLARDIGMMALGPERLLARQDWLYGWKDG